MKRKTAVKTILDCLQDNDIVIFLGAGLCKEAYNYDRDGNLYIKDNSCSGLSIALGIAMNTNKRVFIFCNDSDLLKNISCMLNISISRCKNIFMVILNSGRYQESGGQFTIFDSISTPKNILFSMGFTVFEYTNYLKSKNSLKELKQLIDRSIGPVVSFIKISPGIDCSNTIDEIDYISITDRIKTFIQNTDVGTSLYGGV